MPNPLQITLSLEARQELETLVKVADKAYLRERAAAILKIADGMSANQVAQKGLLQTRQVDTVCEWVHRYQLEGIDGLYIRAGRGRKPAFSPKVSD